MLTLVVFSLHNFLRAQQIKLLTSGTNTSIRGLSVVNDGVVWVSGSNGTVARSTDSGNTFKWMTVKGFEKTDFRDIEAFDATTAVIIGIAEPAYILRTNDGGETWEQVYENKRKSMFLDAMEFWSPDSGIVVGDPIDGNFFIALTSDGGRTWEEIHSFNYPLADSMEGCFASSGTNIRKPDQQAPVFVTGGLHSNLVMPGKKILLPIIQGKETTGANSVAVKKKHTLIIVGGDFSKRDDTTKNCFISTDRGNSWTPPQTPPHGYRSCVEWLGKKRWVCCGLNGVDYSLDEGNNWRYISQESFHVCRRAKNGKAVFFAGGNGRIGKLSPL